jgi:uncharacterized protein YllA (UPF0747 family)
LKITFSPAVAPFDLSILKQKAKRKLADKNQTLELVIIPGAESEKSKMGFTW